MLALVLIILSFVFKRDSEDSVSKRNWRWPATRFTKTLKMVVAMVTSFFIFWLSYQISLMIFVLLPRPFPGWKLLSFLTMDKERKSHPLSMADSEVPKNQIQDFMNFSKMNDSSYDNRSSGPPPSFQAYDVVAVVIYIVVFVVGVPGNALVLWVTVSEARRSVNAIWFLNLAVADLLSCLALPIHIMTILMHGNWLLGDTACSVLTAVFYINLYASVLLLATISADRFLLVFRPIWCQKYRMARLAWLASGVAWMLALVLTIPFLVFGEFFEDFLSQTALCVVVLTIGREDFDLAFNVTLFFLTFLGPLVTMIVCYSCLLLRAWRRPATRSTKTLKVVVAVVTCFFIFWLPYQVTRMIVVMWDINSYKSFYVFPSRIEMALAYVNCCINPIIYVAAARGLHIRVFKFRPGRLRQLLTEG
ncbi:C5a anaphylatoxin chemotactic receptor 1-like [Suncus etruscus]|uniref:C5a anaphylatoxin chemotactic receptor 1-like n=1 Tax=Suncus etruscus TaxID=109475 RepID=UPI0021108B82|nr:C5a anaphylatoxin chemotactic receptor 1-like [Suncus etruscus]